MRFDLITLFPAMFDPIRDLGVTGRAHRQGIWQLHPWNPRDFTQDAHRTVDDRPYGGGPGMVMMVEPLHQAVAAARQARASMRGNAPVVLFTPTGRRFDQGVAQSLSEGEGAILVCGRYEGIDQRFIDREVDIELSLGDFVLSGGEIPAMALMDAVVRLLPGVLNDADSARFDSFNGALSGLLDSPHYTRPEIHEGESVPAELLSGHHAQIALWRRRQSLTLTAGRRPDLIERARSQGWLTSDDERWLAGLPGGRR
ncbi:MAG: tRNA (guanosine(37)-N1)-methyltransferase TrmD [Corticimicrobacter sp.]|uniref:tRNA (guanosine(37)-N1)-methyltransferase TrmD n=1 Tax=Corticimicrobacter sp. TaxID=2678536 RepID=UPI0032DA2FB7